MADKQATQSSPASPPPPVPPAPSHPEPPPYRPDKDLIGYIEEGQKPPAPPPRTGAGKR